MKTDIKCIGCFVNQMISIISRIDISQDKKNRVVSDMLKIISEIDFSVPAPVAAKKMYAELSRVTGIADPFSEIKKRSNELGTDIVSDVDLVLSEINGDDELKFVNAVKYLISANIIDYGAHTELTEEQIFAEMNETAEMYFDIPSVQRFRNDIKKAETVLYIGDNAGEIMVDSYFIRKFLSDKNVIFCTRGRHVINDITIADAEYAEINKIAKIIDTGDSTPGIDINLISPALVDAFAEADIVIAKGQGNFETLGDSDIKSRICELYGINIKAEIYCLFKVKCQHVADFVQKKYGSMVILSF